MTGKGHREDSVRVPATGGMCSRCGKPFRCHTQSCLLCTFLQLLTTDQKTRRFAWVKYKHHLSVFMFSSSSSPWCCTDQLQELQTGDEGENSTTGTLFIPEIMHLLKVFVYKPTTAATAGKPRICGHLKKSFCLSIGPAEMKSL